MVDVVVIFMVQVLVVVVVMLVVMVEVMVVVGYWVGSSGVGSVGDSLCRVAVVIVVIVL